MHAVENSVRGWTAWFAFLLALAYWPTLAATGTLLLNSEDMAHGFFAPIVAGYIVWQNRADFLRRKEPLSAEFTASAFGIALVATACVLGVLATLGGSTTFSRFGFLLSLAGCILLLGGWHLLQLVRFPILLLLFTFPIPAALYGEITLPLQLLASRLAEWNLEVLGYSVLREGNILELAHQRLNVVEACSGIRSLVTLSFFCLVYAYFFETKKWLQWVVTLMALPAAIFLNAVRITLTGVLSKNHPEWTHGTPHEILGWGIFVVGFAMVFLVHRAIRAVGSS